MERVYINEFVNNLPPNDLRKLEKQAQNTRKLAGFTAIAAGAMTMFGLAVLPEALQDFPRNARYGMNTLEIGALITTMVSSVNFVKSFANLDSLKKESARRTLGNALPIHHYPSIQNYENIAPSKPFTYKLKTEEEMFEQSLDKTDQETLESTRDFYNLRKKYGAVITGLAIAAALGAIEATALTGNLGIIHMLSVCIGAAIAPAGFEVMARDSQRVALIQQKINAFTSNR